MKTPWDTFFVLFKTNTLANYVRWTVQAVGERCSLSAEHENEDRLECVVPGCPWASTTRRVTWIEACRGATPGWTRVSCSAAVPWSAAAVRAHERVKLRFRDATCAACSGHVSALVGYVAMSHELKCPNRVSGGAGPCRNRKRAVRCNICAYGNGYDHKTRLSIARGGWPASSLCSCLRFSWVHKYLTFLPPSLAVFDYSS